MISRGYFDVGAKWEDLKRGSNKGVDTDTANTRLEWPCRHGHTIADLQRCLLPVQRTDLRILDDLGVTVAEQRRRRSLVNRNLEVGRIQIGKGIQVDAGRR